MTIEFGKSFIFEIGNHGLYARLWKREVFISRASGFIWSVTPQAGLIDGPSLA